MQEKTKSSRREERILVGVKPIQGCIKPIQYGVKHIQDEDILNQTLPEQRQTCTDRIQTCPRDRADFIIV